jgi:Circularly permutated YpsA SLOG family
MIFSGGQTGVDRAALDAAIETGMPYAGWCPKGGWAEDLPRPPGVLAVYPRLRPTPLADSAQRTEWNVRDADRLMVLVDSSGLNVSNGSAAARGFAVKLGKPHVVLDLDAGDALDGARVFLGEAQGELVLCLAGPRESEAPDIYAKAHGFLRRLFDWFGSQPVPSG